MNPDDKVLALIPAYNEAARITPVIRGAAVHLPVLVVDDGSRDNTADVAQAAGAEVVRHPLNRGKGAALLTGYQWALEHGYAAVAMLDADGQHDPAELPAFLDAYRQGRGDLIIGCRDFRRIPLVRRMSNSIGRSVLGWALGQAIRDNQCGYRLLNRNVIQCLRPTVGGFEFEVEMIAQAIAAGLRLHWVSIRTIYADERSHIEPLGHVLRFFRLAWRLRWQRLRKNGSR